MKVYSNGVTVLVRDSSIKVSQFIGMDVEVILPSLEFTERRLESINFYTDNTLVMVTFSVEDHFERFTIDLSIDADEICTIGIIKSAEDVYKTEKYNGMVFVR